MGPKVVFKGINEKGVEYRIFNIDNIYTIYIKTDEQQSYSENNQKEIIFSAYKSFKTLKEAKDYVSTIDK